MAEIKNLWDRIFEFNRYFRLIQAVTAFCFHSLSLYFFVATLRWVRRTKLSSISTLLKFFLVVWIVEDTIAVPYSVYIAAGWRHNAGDTYFEISFWTVVWERSFSCVIPITVCFLTVDRCLAIGLGIAYRTVHSNVLCGACILAGTCASTLALYIHLWAHLVPEEVANAASEGCDITVCAFQRPDDWQAVVRVIFGTINLVSTVGFGFLLRQQRSKNLLHKTNSKNTVGFTQIERT
ncbi:hypothetical protein AAVH_20743 [Aphelenchoides avenae]|nr:hypothetical protein AAVH_20743 [Aphelenchus avenae]